MIHDLLLALVGHPGGIFFETEDGFAVSADADFVSEAERHLVEQIAQVGFYCKRLGDFAACVRGRHFRAAAGLGQLAGTGSAPPPGRPARVGAPSLVAGKATTPESERHAPAEPSGHYVYAMARRLEEVLDDYRNRIAEVEAELLHEPSLPLAHVAAAVEEDRRLLKLLFGLVQKVQAQGLAGGSLLDLLFEVAANYAGAGVVHECLWSVASAAGQVLANQLVGWMVFGRLVDPDGEFFIGRGWGHHPSDDHPSSLAASGAAAVDDLSEEVDAATAQRDWQGRFFLRPEAVPTRVMSPETAAKVLFVGKAVRVLLRSNRWGPGSLGVQDGGSEVEGSLDPPALQEEVDAIRRCFGAKSPAFVVEHSVERVRASAAMQLRQVVVQEASLATHLAALKGVYLLGYGAFYQTFLEVARGMLQQRPPPHAEHALSHGPWAVAMAELEATFDALPADAAVPPTPLQWRGAITHSGTASLEHALLGRFEVRFVLNRLELEGFADAARQLKLVGMVRLVGGAIELGVGRGGAAPQPAMVWLASRQRVARGFSHAFSFQIQAPPPSGSVVSPEYGTRIALTFQPSMAMGELQRWRQQPPPQATASPATPFPAGAAEGGNSGGATGAGGRCPGIWTTFGECLAMEVGLRVLPSGGALDPIGELSVAVYLCLPSPGDVASQVSSTGGSVFVASAGQCALLRLAFASKSVSAPRGAVHAMRMEYDAARRELQVFYGAHATAPICVATVDLGEALSLDLGCAFVGLSLLPLDHRHHVLGAGSLAPSTEVRYSTRDRPASIISWRHQAFVASEAGDGARVEEVTASGACHDAWFAGMELSCKVPWPLPLVITQRCLDRYNQLFKLLISFRHAHLELQRVDLPQTELLGWALRAELSYFVSQVLLYFQQDVIEAAHRRLLQTVAASQDFDVVVNAHEEFLSTAASRCFLGTPELHGALMAALRTATLFCRLAPAAAAASARPTGTRRLAALPSAGAAEWHRLRGEFVATVRQVLRMMNSMHRLGMHTHLAQLLLRLDYNGYFSGELHIDE